MLNQIGTDRTKAYLCWWIVKSSEVGIRPGSGPIGMGWGISQKQQCPPDLAPFSLFGRMVLVWIGEDLGDDEDGMGQIGRSRSQRPPDSQSLPQYAPFSLTVRPK